MFAKHTDFYDGFQKNFYRYKQRLNSRTFNEIQSEPDSKSKNDLLNTIRIDSRICYITSLETLFQLIIALKPSDKYNADKLILQNLSKKQFYFDDISKFGRDEPSIFDFLCEEYNTKNGQVFLKAKHIFYFLLNPTNDERLEWVNESVISIIQVLKTLANELSDRREYNAYKHGLRIFPAWTKFAIATKDLKSKVEFNLENSFTLMEFDLKIKKTTSVTVRNDIERDFKMTELVSDLIESIIGLRQYFFKDRKDGIPLTDFSKINLEHYTKRNVENDFMEFNIESKNEI